MSGKGLRPTRAPPRGKTQAVPAVSPLVRGGRVLVAGICIFVGITGAGLRGRVPGSNARPVSATATAPTWKRLAGNFDQHGQCYVDGLINGEPFSLLVDSGADMPLFSRNHLPRLGV